MNQPTARSPQPIARTRAGTYLADFSLPAEGFAGTLLRWLFFFAALVLLHWPLLRLPYFWDEAGYYIPAARDIFLFGDLIPRTTLSNAHPPLVMLWLAACWKLFGYSITVTRVAMLAVSAFALTGVFRLAHRLANRSVAWATVACTALYPVYFAQSSMAHVDLAAAAFTIWGLGAWLGAWLGTVAELPTENAALRRQGPERNLFSLFRLPAFLHSAPGPLRGTLAAGFWFSLAALAKETAILAPLALLCWEAIQWLLVWRSGASGQTNASDYTPLVANLVLRPADLPRTRLLRMATLLLPALPLAAWFAYHYAATGYIFGNPEFVRYNVTATMQPARIALALLIRIWQTFGYEHLWLLTGLVIWAMRKPALREGNSVRPRIAIPIQVTLLVVALAYISAMAVVGGAVLARYMLPVIPLVILPWVSTLWRRVRHWNRITVAICAFMIVGWLWNPPYEFSPEDNLAYRDFIELQQDSITHLQQHYPKERVLTAWPASDELTRPFLGYVPEPRNVVRIENFTVPEMMLAAGARNDFQVALVFSTKYEPTPLLPFLRPEWDRLKSRFFDYHRDVDSAAAAAMLNGRIVFEEHRTGLVASVIEVQPIVLANNK